MLPAGTGAALCVRRRKTGEPWLRTEASWSDQGSKLSVTTRYLDGIEPLLSFAPSTVCPVAEIGMCHPDSPYGRYNCLSCWESCGQRFQLPFPHTVFPSEWLKSSDALSSTSGKSEGLFSFSSRSSEAADDLYHSSASPSAHSRFLAFTPIAVDSKNVP